MYISERNHVKLFLKGGGKLYSAKNTSTMTKYLKEKGIL